MNIWTFYDFIESSGQNPIQRWLGGLPVDAQAAIDARLLQMQGLLKWSDKWVSRYHAAAKLYELRITFNKVAYRPLGIYAPEHKFILLTGAIEKGGKIPKSTITTAVRRMKEVAEDLKNVRRHEIS
tara:strand:+ start:302 stop:679 length:378 start_codon:yes stop_codon:yes gene_type:complete